jgi:hypothetical protein
MCKRRSISQMHCISWRELDTIKRTITKLDPIDICASFLESQVERLELRVLVRASPAGCHSRSASPDCGTPNVV